jgi:hypothetical protein
VNEWLGGQEQENGVKFQQHNSSKKIDDQMRRGGVSFIPKNGKERGLGWLPSVGNQKERKL